MTDVRSRSQDVDTNDDALLRALRDGDERVFGQLVGRWSGIMLRLALAHVETRAIAEEVVQEAWLTVLRCLDRFERRSALRTWVLGIVVNVARSRARAERRTVPLSEAVDGPSVDPERFLPADHPRWPGHWAVPPEPWHSPEDELLAGETRHVILDAIVALPAAQREVLVLRDIEGLRATDVRKVLHITASNERVLLHRARTRVRQALERYFAAETT